MSLDKLLVEAERMVRAGASPGGLDSIEVQCMDRMIKVVRRQRKFVSDQAASECYVMCGCQDDAKECQIDVDRIAKGQMTREEKNSYDADKCL